MNYDDAIQKAEILEKQNAEIQDQLKDKKKELFRIKQEKTQFDLIREDLESSLEEKKKENKKQKALLKQFRNEISEFEEKDE